MVMQSFLTYIIDHSRFTSAGMETANKAICAQILKEFDEETNIISYTALCPWDYICDYRADRFPNYLLKARCTTSVCSGNCSPENKRHNMCQSHTQHSHDYSADEKRRVGLRSRTPTNSLYLHKQCQL